jgi:hypothetical protein
MRTITIASALAAVLACAGCKPAPAQPTADADTTSRGTAEAVADVSAAQNLRSAVPVPVTPAAK